MKRKVLSVLAFIVIAVAGCSGGSTDTNAQFEFGGVWTGSFLVTQNNGAMASGDCNNYTPVGTRTNLDIRIVQNGTAVTITFVGDNRIVFTGTATDDSFAATLQPFNGGCGTVTGTITGTGQDNAISGVWSVSKNNRTATLSFQHVLKAR